MDVLIDLLFLTILASMAHKLKKPLLSGLVFGILKSVSLYLLYIAELESSPAEAGIIGLTHFALNALLGYAIAWIVINRSNDTKMIILMTILTVLGFLTHTASLNVTTLF